MSFRDYLCEEISRGTDIPASVATIRTEGNGVTVDDVLSSADPAVWTAREIGGRKYVFYGGRYADLTAAVDEISRLYSSKGYSGYGFAKLAEPDLVRYSAAKAVIMRCMGESVTEETDPAHIASCLFAAEPKDFDWKPEEY